MPHNIKGKHYDLRPYFDELGWLVIDRGSNKMRFKLNGKKLICRNIGYYHVDRYDLEMMKRQARKILSKYN